MAANDYAEIANLIAEWSWAIDSRDWTRVASLLAHATFKSPLTGQPLSGEQAMAEHYPRAVDGTNAKWLASLGQPGDPQAVGTKHVFTNLLITIAEDGLTATAQYYGTVFAFTDQVPVQPRFSGRYYDRFAKVDGRWRFVERNQVGDYYPHAAKVPGG